MQKYKAPEGCTSLSLGGVEVEIKDGVCLVDQPSQFLVEHGFTPIYDNVGDKDAGLNDPLADEKKAQEEAEKKAKEEALNALKEEATVLGVKFPDNIGFDKLSKLVEDKKVELAGAKA